MTPIAADERARRSDMTIRGKVLLVIGGYLLALLAAIAVAGCYIAATSGPERESAAGMYAFGDSLVFLGAFGLAAIPATSFALWCLRPHRWFWAAACAAALAMALTGIAAWCGIFWFRSADPGSWLGMWAMLSPLRILLAPLCAIAFFLFGLFAPQRALRGVFLTASIVETAVFVSVALKWFHSG